MTPRSVVWKFAVPPPGPDGNFVIQLPKDAKVLTFDYDGRGTLCTWAEIPIPDDMKMTPLRCFRIVMTGQEFEFQGNYISTNFQRPDQPWLPTIVGHVYEIES